MASSDLLQCYNKGCGQKFDLSNTKDDACKYHPGAPVFHDVLKGWSCCKKRSTDFTEFLNIPGCTTGPHSNEKPVVLEKPKPEPGSIEELIEQQSKPEVIKAPELQERPSLDEPRVRLKATIGATLKQALEKILQNMSLQTSAAMKEGGAVEKGTVCKNSACKKVYEDDNSNLDQCMYHPGVPVFHEGMKYWSCCQRKTSDFENFLNQEGCETGLHLWFKEEPEIKTSCRYDWHQTGSFVIISVFAKVAVPEKSWVESNKVAVTINLQFDGGKCHFFKDIRLFGVIDPACSKVNMLGSKVEISLRKAEPGSWPTLELPPRPVVTEERDNTLDTVDVKTVD